MFWQSFLRARLPIIYVTDRGEHDSFESQYYAAADKVTGMLSDSLALSVVQDTEHCFVPTENFHNIGTEKMEAAGNLVVAMVAHGQDFDA